MKFELFVITKDGLKNAAYICEYCDYGHIDYHIDTEDFKKTVIFEMLCPECGKSSKDIEEGNK